MSNKYLTASEPHRAIRERVAELKSIGAERVNPVRFHQIETMLALAALKEPAVRSVIISKIAVILGEFDQAFKEAVSEADARLQRICEQFPDSAGRASTLFAEYEFTQLSRMEEGLATQASAEHVLNELRNLVSQLNEISDTENSESGLEAMLFETPAGKANNGIKELKSFKKYQAQLERVTTEAFAKRVLEEAPENAGPLNPQRLLIRMLEMMQARSPYYFERMIPYLDSLLWLDQASQKHASAAKSPTRG